MRYFLVYLFQLVIIAGYAQDGHFFLTNHSPADKGIDHVAFDMLQDYNGVLNFATRSGVLTYDGKNWDLINCGGAVYAVEITESGEIFWSGATGFGRLKREKSGRVVSELLSDSTGREVYQALALGNKVYFMNDDAIFIYSDKSFKTIAAREASFTSLFEIFNVPFVQTSLGHSFEINELQLKEPSIHFEGSVLFSSGTSNQYLVGTSENRLLLCTRELEISEVQIQERDYINASELIDGVWVNDDLIALGTLRGGVIFINIHNGSTSEIINYSTGLPDNEVLSLLADKNNNVWVSHDYGFTRIAPFVPFRSYSRYDNLKGNLLCAASIHEDVYVGTSLGLFKLNKRETYDEVIYYEDVAVARNALRQKVAPGNETNPVTSPPVKSQDPTAEGSRKKKSGFLRFLRRKSKVDESVRETAGETPGSNPVVPAIDFKPQLSDHEIIIQRLRRTKKVLRAAQFEYEGVGGIGAKVNNVVIANGKLIAGGIDGLFEVNGLASLNILDKPIRFLYSVNDTTLIVSTYDDRVLTLIVRNEKWETKNELGIDDQISFAFQNDLGDLWLCGVENIYHIKGSDDNIVVSIPPFYNQNFSKTVGFYLKNEPVFINANGFYNYNRESHLITKIDSMSAPVTYFAFSRVLWYNDGHSWNVLGESIPNKTIQMLNLCDDIRFIARDEHPENFWIINRDNGLYKFFSNGTMSDSSPFKLFLKSITQNGAALKGGRRQTVSQENGTLEIVVSQADFIDGPLLEYRFLLNGMDESWSEWSRRNDHISFSYLPLGNYTLRVQSRDMFGKISELDPLVFMVQPPYWKTPWFYAMEFTIFALLVLLSFKLSVRYRLISRVLSLLTIILLIEFIQTIIGISFFTNSSPMIDFLIQVIVALIILPVEGFLRKLMFRSMGSNSKLFDVIAELDRQQKSKK
ncbi:MAG TPA: triple tyrosine motif-containing protein [Cyclobacteriaceae bacterium]|nr:triple tyrosine motif-containing protein [Cyclobacteriaceae bacterium]